MVRMQVGDRQHVDIGGRHANRTQGLGQLAESRSERIGRTGIDENEFAAGIHKVGRDGNALRPRRLKRGVGELACFGRVKADQQLFLRIEITVEQGGDFDVADPAAEDARKRGAGLGRHCCSRGFGQHPGHGGHGGQSGAGHQGAAIDRHWKLPVRNAVPARAGSTEM